MRINYRNGWLPLAAATFGLVAVVRVAAAAPTIEQSGSIVIFPKVLATSTRDTLIEISNSGNLMAHAHCIYVDAQIEGRWQEIDFDIWLTKQQPTHWLASEGRRFDPFDDFGSDGAGFDPGLVPPVSPGFEGELRCFQVDEAGAPRRANSLKGNATLIRNDGDVSKYNAVVLQGNPTVLGDTDTDNVLQLNNTPTHVGEYDACPDTLTVSLLSQGSTDPILEDLGNCIGSDCPITTEITLVPCSADYERARGARVGVNINVYNEFEQFFSTFVEVDCWLNIRLDDMVFSGAFTEAVLGTLGAHARLNPSAGEGGVVGVAEELRTDSDDDSAWAAFNLHYEGNRFDAARDIDGNLLSGLACSGGGNDGGTCSSDGDCPDGACINGVADEIVIQKLFTN